MKMQLLKSGVAVCVAKHVMETVVAALSTANTVQSIAIVITVAVVVGGALGAVVVCRGDQRSVVQVLFVWRGTTAPPPAGGRRGSG